MSEFATLARPYATALFNLSKAKSIDFSGSLEILSVITSDPQFIEYSTNPLIDKITVAKFLSKFSEFDHQTQVESLILTLSDNSRLPLVSEINEQYKIMMNSEKGISKILIFSAFDLKQSELQKLIEKLEKKYNAKFESELIVDPTLLGGLRIEIGDKVLDGSVRAKLDRLKSNLIA